MFGNILLQGEEGAIGFLLHVSMVLLLQLCLSNSWYRYPEIMNNMSKKCHVTCVAMSS